MKESEETRAVWHVYTVQVKFMGEWDYPRRFTSWFDAIAYYRKIKGIIDEVKANPNSDLAILGFEDVRMGEDRGY